MVGGSWYNIDIQHDDVIKWKHIPLYWPFVWGIHRSLVNSQHNGQWRGALRFSLICAWINGWANNREAGDLRRHSAHYVVTEMKYGLNSMTDVKEITKPCVVCNFVKYRQVVLIKGQKPWKVSTSWRHHAADLCCSCYFSLWYITSN